MQAVEIWHGCCIYERLATFMGFEGALLAMALEPEATFELLSVLADFRIEMLKHFVKYYQPDIYIFFDDVATERMLFMSPDTYRALIKPLHTRMVDACKELGVIPVQHTCGRADLLVQDMIDEGNHAWHAVQAQNDLEGIIAEHGDHFVLMGGYNTTGAPGQPTATEEMVRAEVRRCIETYGKFGKGYIFNGLVLTETNPNDPFDMGYMNTVIGDEFAKIRAEQTA
jgi:uroporphyrinogen-III decarboxylase